MWLVKTCTILFILASNIYASTMQTKTWETGETFLTFLHKNNLPQNLFYDLGGDDQKLTQEIIAGIKYQILKDENKNIKQVLIPIGEELQIHIYKDKNQDFKFQITPILFTTKKKTQIITIISSPYKDIVRQTDNPELANAFLAAFGGSINFKRDIRLGDRLVVIYEQKQRLGQNFSTPIIKASMVEVRKKMHYIFNYKDKYYNQKGKELQSYFMTVPLRYSRISDPFTYKRWHPIKKIYRPHLGIDYAAPTGRPVWAAASGKVTFKGRKGGYGNTIEISHGSGYKTLYAHLNKFKKGIKRGKRVKQKQIIGYVGSTGLSTGPHLHFGLYKNNRAINPSKVVKITKTKLTGKKKKSFLSMVKKYKKQIKEYI